MSTSRRAFLRNTIAGATAAMGDLEAFVFAPSLSAATESLPTARSTQAEASATATEYTRGIGVYPGDSSEDFAPTLVHEASTYRNLALHRPAYHSSSYDYNLTAQLITDGIKDTHLPDWVATSVSYRGLLPKVEREFFLDHNADTSVDLRGSNPWVQVQLEGGVSAPEIDRIEVLFTAPSGVRKDSLNVSVLVSNDGRNWEEAGKISNPTPAPIDASRSVNTGGPQTYKPSIHLHKTSQCRFYRIGLEVVNVPPFSYFMEWQLAEVAFFNRDQRVEVGGPYRFTSAWMSAGLGEEWVYVDLGASCEFDRVVLAWIARAAEGSLQVSDDAQYWRDIQPLPGATGNTDDLRLSPPSRSRYVRVLMKRPSSPDGYILSEMEVYGHGGPTVQAKPPREPEPDGRLDLSGGAWRLQRDSVVNGDGAALSKAGFPDRDWVVATVPGTVLASYRNIEAIPDPNFGENQLLHFRFVLLCGLLVPQ